MRRMGYALGLLLFGASSSAHATPKIDSVVVFEDRAEVTRSGELQCSQGEGTLAFEGLPQSIDERTLRATVEGGEALGVSSRRRELTEPADARVQTLRAELRKVDDAMVVEQQKMQTTAEQLRSVQAYGGWFMPLVAESLREARPVPGKWTAAFDALRGERLTLEREAVASNKKLRELALERNRLQRELNERTPRGPEAVIDARVAVKCGRGSAKVSLSYVVPGASWSPEYDLRFELDRPKKQRSGTGQAELTVAAVVRQSTGEDWRDAKLVLSTARPRAGAEAPYPAPVYVTGYEFSEERVLVQGQEERKGLGGSAARQGRGPSDAELEDRGTAVSLTMSRRVTVLNDGRPYWMPVDVLNAPATSALVAIPKRDRRVFHAVRLDNPAGYPLVAGPMHMHRGGTWVGDIQLPHTAPGEPMELSLGTDGSIRAERILRTDKNKKGGFWSSDRTLTQAFVIQLSNRGERPAKIEVRENIPVSKTEEVKVRVDVEKTTRGYELDAHRGFITWTIPLKSRGDGRVDLKYDIELPESWKIQK